MTPVLILCLLATSVCGYPDKRFIFSVSSVHNVVNNKVVNTITDDFKSIAPIFNGYKQLIVQDPSGGRGENNLIPVPTQKRLIDIVKIKNVVNKLLKSVSESKTEIQAPIFGGVQRFWNQGKRDITIKNEPKQDKREIRAPEQDAADQGASLPQWNLDIGGVINGILGNKIGSGSPDWLKGIIGQIVKQAVPGTSYEKENEKRQAAGALPEWNLDMSQLINGILGDNVSKGGPDWLKGLINQIVTKAVGKRSIDFGKLDPKKLIGSIHGILPSNVTSSTDGNTTTINGEGTTVVDIGNGCRIIITPEGQSTFCESNSGHVVNNSTTIVDGKVTNSTVTDNKKPKTVCHEVKTKFGSSKVCTSQESVTDTVTKVEKKEKTLLDILRELLG